MAHALPCELRTSLGGKINLRTNLAFIFIGLGSAALVLGLAASLLQKH